MNSPDLARIAADLRAGRPLAPADLALAADTLAGLARGPGQRSPATMAALDDRDRLLRDAAERHLSHLPTIAARADALAEALSRFAASAWVRERGLDTCPARHLGTIREACWRALKAADRPLSVRSIRAVLAAN